MIRLQNFIITRMRCQMQGLDHHNTNICTSNISSGHSMAEMLLPVGGRGLKILTTIR